MTDQLMPGMTGSDLIKVAQKERPDLPIILATGFGDLALGAAAGAHRLAKPYRQRDLAAAIEAAIRRGKSPAAVLPFRQK